MSSIDISTPVGQKAKGAKFNTYYKGAVWSLVALTIMTVVHHLYGEFFLYRDGVRMKQLWVAPITAALTILPLWLYRERGSKIALWAFGVLNMVFWVLMLGIIEGFGAHVIPDVLMVIGAPEEAITAVLRAISEGLMGGRMGMRLEPGDLVFELTGSLQFLFALPVAFYTYKLIREETTT